VYTIFLAVAVVELTFLYWQTDAFLRLIKLPGLTRTELTEKPKIYISDGVYRDEFQTTIGIGFAEATTRRTTRAVWHDCKTRNMGMVLQIFNTILVVSVWKKLNSILFITSIIIKFFLLCVLLCTNVFVNNILTPIHSSLRRISSIL